MTLFEIVPLFCLYSVVLAMTTSMVFFVREELKRIGQLIPVLEYPNGTKVAFGSFSEITYDSIMGGYPLRWPEYMPGQLRRFVESQLGIKLPPAPVVYTMPPKEAIKDISIWLNPVDFPPEPMV